MRIQTCICVLPIFWNIKCVDQFIHGDRKDPNFFKNLEEQINKIPIGSDGLILQPYTGGVMDPYWDSYARGIIVGLSISHTPYHVYRSILEGLTLDSVFRTQNIEKETDSPEEDITGQVTVGSSGDEEQILEESLALHHSASLASIPEETLPEDRVVS